MADIDLSSLDHLIKIKVHNLNRKQFSIIINRVQTSTNVNIFSVDNVGNDMLFNYFYSIIQNVGLCNKLIRLVI